MKCICTMRRCGWHGEQDDILIAPNPFDADDEINGCPNCKQIDTIVTACDEPGCWAAVSCGTPTPTGYRNTCDKHHPV